jgi:NAD(P)-dependent dehydrogenase (short-subunit alcohol dehydrogenase family)
MIDLYFFPSPNGVKIAIMLEECELPYRINRVDITKGEQVIAAAENAADVDILINNAGVASFSSILDGPRDLVVRDMNTNYYGTLDMVRAFVPVLETKKGAAIVNIVTIAAFANFPIIGGYSASKAALFSLSQGIRIELASRGIAVHTVNPGPIDTELAKEFPTDKADTNVTEEEPIPEGKLIRVPSSASLVVPRLLPKHDVPRQFKQ